MLVLTRKKSESIIIGDQLVTITVVEIKGNCVRIGIEAAREIPVHRAEVRDRITAEGNQ